MSEDRKQEKRADSTSHACTRARHEHLNRDLELVSCGAAHSRTRDRGITQMAQQNSSSSATTSHPVTPPLAFVPPLGSRPATSAHSPSGPDYSPLTSSRVHTTPQTTALKLGFVSAPGSAAGKQLGTGIGYVRQPGRPAARDAAHSAVHPHRSGKNGTRTRSWLQVSYSAVDLMPAAIHRQRRAGGGALAASLGTVQPGTLVSDADKDMIKEKEVRIACLPIAALALLRWARHHALRRPVRAVQAKGHEAWVAWLERKKAAAPQHQPLTKEE